MESMTPDIVLAAECVSLRYGATRALDCVSLAVRRGTITAIVGANGCGKTSLLRVLAQVIEPGGHAGTVTLAGVDQHGTAAARATRRAFVPQRPEVSASFTAREVVRLGRHAIGTTEAGVGRALEDVGLSLRADQTFHTLSGGERQRVAIARAFAQLDSGGVWLLDEPLSGVDPAEVARIIGALCRRVTSAATGSAAVLTLHDPGLARAIATDAIVMREGRVLASGDAASVLVPSILSEAYRHEMVEAPCWLAPRLGAGVRMRS